MNSIFLPLLELDSGPLLDNEKRQEIKFEDGGGYTA